MLTERKGLFAPFFVDYKGFMLSGNGRKSMLHSDSRVKVFAPSLLKLPNCAPPKPFGCIPVSRSSGDSLVFFLCHPAYNGSSRAPGWSGRLWNDRLGSFIQFRGDSTYLISKLLVTSYVVALNIS